MSDPSPDLAAARAALYEASVALNRAIDLMHQIDTSTDTKVIVDASFHLPEALMVVTSHTNAAFTALMHAAPTMPKLPTAHEPAP